MRCLGFALLFALALTTSAAVADSSDCHLGKYVTLPMTIGGGGLVSVPIGIEDETDNMLVDTGGVFSTLTERVVKHHNLRQEMLQMAWLTMFGGRKIDHFVTVPQITIGRFPVPNRTFMVMPDDALPPDMDGIIAPDMLAAFDVEFDMAGGALSLFSQDHCDGKVVYWTKGDSAAVPFRMDDWRHMKVEVLLDGEEIKADIDTGASDSIMSLETAEHLFGWDSKTDNTKHTFKSLSFEGVSVQNPMIHLIPDDKSKIMGGYGEAKLILGMSILRKLHFYIAFREHNIYITPAEQH